MTSKSIQFYNKFPEKAGEKYYLENLYGSNQSFAINEIVNTTKVPIVLITPDLASLTRLKQELKFFRGNENLYPILTFPDWETLPYDQFSPHIDIISERLSTLYKLPSMKTGVVIIALNTLMYYLMPRTYLEENSLILKCGEKFDITNFKNRLEKYGYRFVSEVVDHGEFRIRGSLIDIFPMGSKNPYRIDLYDEIIESLRTFNPETQLSTGKVDSINLLPAKEFSLSDITINRFRNAWRDAFPGDPTECAIYQNITRGESSPGIEYYLKLFFEELNTFFDYLPKNSLLITHDDINAKIDEFWNEINHRYEELRYDIKNPILAPKEIFLTIDKLHGLLNNFPKVQLTLSLESPLPDLSIDHAAKEPLAKLVNFLKNTSDRILFSVESEGRRESLVELLKKNIEAEPEVYKNWPAFMAASTKLGIIITPLEKGARLEIKETHDYITLITESELFGAQISQKRLNKKPYLNPEAIISNLTELSIGAKVVHLEHGIGKYLGLQKIKTLHEENEFLALEYKNQAKLYIPITSLHLISRYTGGAENVPLNHLGTSDWKKTKEEALKKIHDVASLLLQIYANRATKSGFVFKKPDVDYEKFASSFPFEETLDQKKAIEATISDMTSSRIMDRLICGDVGFGKTEVAMRAAFIAAFNHKQVAILTPTTLLAEQHYRNFSDRFFDWPIKIEMLSRFRSPKEQIEIIKKLKNGQIDICIGTHKILQPTVVFKDLGLLIIDEEHRFGVKQKERIKAIRPEVDTLTLTATPIPRTLNMAFIGIRDFSIIATPPAGRLAIKTFVKEQNNHLIREAILREILRGGQVYFLQNDILTIKKTAIELEKLIPEARISIAHGQMRERELEKIMSDFYHRRFNLLICTTIIESGIDVPSANTIIINRADRFGLAQLHQLRGRVGRSHHQAYAYLLTPPFKLLTTDAKKRLLAIEKMEDLGTGFILATQDLEIRGAGEILGEDQSGQIDALGFDLYMEYLERAISALKNGEILNLESSIMPKVTEIDLKIPAIIPDDYLDDINMRLIFYKRIANAKTHTDIEDLKIEMIDRFSLLPEALKNLFASTEIRILAEEIGIKKIIANVNQGSIEFSDQPKVNATKIIELIQKEPEHYKLKGSSRFEFIQKNKSAKELIEYIKKLIMFIKNP